MADIKENQMSTSNNVEMLRGLDASGNSVLIKPEKMFEQSSIKRSVSIPKNSQVTILIDNRIYAVTDSNYGASALIDITWEPSYLSIIYQTKNNKYSINGETLYVFQKAAQGRALTIVNNSDLDAILLLTA